MLSKTVLVLLIICAVLVPDCEGWRRRRRRRFWRSVGRFVGDVAKTALKPKATAVLVGALGKRDADCGPDLTPEETNAVVQQLEQTCPGLGLDLTLGLTSNVIDAAFAESDANTDGALAGDELDDFLTVIRAIDECEDFAEQK
ncbi:uncharacterized protein [Littorina saxatilis]|uniref:uncharacterized protein n=1 Tax=Littorina saxatilis TaxID=31220 RepID=UPI0038B624B7